MRIAAPGVLRFVATVLIAAVGGMIAAWIGLPAAWLSGAMIAVAVAALAGLNAQMPRLLMDVIFLVLGVTLGSGVTPEVVDSVASWPISLGGLLVSIVLVVVCVQTFLTRVAGWDRDTAFFSAIPGALSYVLAVAVDTRSDLRKVAVSQSIRVFLLVAVLPGVVAATGGEPSPSPAPVVVSPGAIALLLVAAGVVALIFRRLRVPAAPLAGGLAVSSVLHGTGTTAGTLPGPMVIVAFVMLGAMIGARFTGTDIRLLRQIGLASLGAFVVATGAAALMAVAVATIAGEPLAQVVIAYAPGGLEAMTTLSLALHMDTAFVAAHQLARFVAIALFLPLVARGALARGTGRKPPPG